MMVTCPEGATVGTFLTITTPTGQQMQVAVPLGVNPGTVFQVHIPAPAPPPVAVATAVAVNPVAVATPADPVAAIAVPPAQELKTADNMPTL